jgi:hypothetical protein
MTQKNDEKGNWLKRKSKIGHVKKIYLFIVKSMKYVKAGKINTANLHELEEKRKFLNFEKKLIRKTKKLKPKKSLERGMQGKGELKN